MNEPYTQVKPDSCIILQCTDNWKRKTVLQSEWSSWVGQSSGKQGVSSEGSWGQLPEHKYDEMHNNQRTQSNLCSVYTSHQVSCLIVYWKRKYFRDWKCPLNSFADDYITLMVLGKFPWSVNSWKLCNQHQSRCQTEVTKHQNSIAVSLETFWVKQCAQNQCTGTNYRLRGVNI